MIGLCRPWEGAGRQERAVPALGGCRPLGDVSACPGGGGGVQGAWRGLGQP